MITIRQSPRRLLHQHSSGGSYLSVRNYYICHPTVIPLLLPVVFTFIFLYEMQYAHAPAEQAEEDS